MATQASEINAVVGLPDEHSFGFDYLMRFPVVSNLPRPRDVFDWLGNTGYWQWVDTAEVKDLMGFVNEQGRRGVDVVGKGLALLRQVHPSRKGETL